MSLLAGTLYDPAAAVSKATSSLLAMTAVDTTNLRLTFTCPANGTVMVRLACQVTGATSYPTILLGVLDGATVRGRAAPMGSFMAALATDYLGQEAWFPVTGLTPGQSYTWDAAYGVETIVAASNIKYGGPDNTTANDAWGGFAFEVWDAISILGAKMYDPATAVALSGGSLLAMTAMDNTNLRIPLVIPPSGKVYWHARVPVARAGAVWGQIMIGIMSGSTVFGRVAATRGAAMAGATTAIMPHDASGIVSGIAAGTSVNFDLAYDVETISSNASGTVKYGGPNNAVANDAWGGIMFNCWAV